MSERAHVENWVSVARDKWVAGSDDLLRDAKAWADKYRDNDISWEGHGDTLSEAAELIDRLLARLDAPALHRLDGCA